MKDAIDDFLQNNEMDFIKIKTTKPESMKVKAWRFLKKFEERTKINPNIRISLEKDGILLSKEKLEIVCGMHDGTLVDYKDFKGPSKMTLDYCQKMRDHVKGILPEWDEIELPTEEEINGWDISNVDKEMFLKTLQEIKESSVIRMSEKEQE